MVRRNLGTMDRDMFQALGRPIQEAFKDGLSGSIIRGGLLAGQSHQSPYEESATQNYVLGSVMVKPDGREFVYSKAGGSNLTIATMQQAPAPTSDWAETAQAGHGALAKATSIDVLTTGTDPGADGWKDGYLIVNKGTNTGQMYKIKSNTAAATNVVTCELYDAIVSDIVAADEITVIKNPYNGTVIAPLGGLTAQVVGVPLIAVTTLYYYWAQTKGPAPLLTQGTVVVGDNVGLGGTVNGACGAVITLGASTEYSIVDLKLGV